LSYTSDVISIGCPREFVPFLLYLLAEIFVNSNHTFLLYLLRKSLLICTEPFFFIRILFAVHSLNTVGTLIRRTFLFVMHGRLPSTSAILHPLILSLPCLSSFLNVQELKFVKRCFHLIRRTHLHLPCVVSAVVFKFQYLYFRSLSTYDVCGMIGLLEVEEEVNRRNMV
jgi:hypothetical protein